MKCGRYCCYPSNRTLFQVRGGVVKLTEEEKDHFHSLVMSLQYLAKRVRPDILCLVVFISTGIRRCDQDDWMKTIRVMTYLNGTRDIGIILEPDCDNGLLSIHCYADASSAVHSDFKSHTGIVIPWEVLGYSLISKAEVKHHIEYESRVSGYNTATVAVKTVSDSPGL